MNVEKARKRLKKRSSTHSSTKDKPTNNEFGTTDEHEGTPGISKEPRDNLGYHNENDLDKEVHKRRDKSHAQENLGYEDGQEIGDLSQEPNKGKSKSGKRRRRKLKGLCCARRFTHVWRKN